MDKLSFRVQQVEGPLDLILQLLQKHKLNIYDIEIRALVEQYMAYIGAMKEQDMELASEFLEMAARLVHMKSVSLLPRHEELDELKTQLTDQLLEYQACKQAAAFLGEHSQLGDRFVRAPQPLPKDSRYQVLHQSQELLEAYLAAIGKGKRRLPPPVSAFSALVTRRVVSVSSRIVYILRRLYGGSRMAFDQLFGESQERSELVATFLALLELVKAGRVEVAEGATQELRMRGRKEGGKG